MSISLHRLTRISWSSFPAAFVVPFPEQGVTATIWYTLQRCVTLPIRDLILVANRVMSPSTLPWCEAQYKIQANHCPSPRPRIPTLLYSEGPRSHTNLERLILGHDTILHRPYCTRRPPGTGELNGLSTLLWDQQHPTAMANRHPLICERKKIQLTSPEPL